MSGTRTSSGAPARARTAVAAAALPAGGPDRTTDPSRSLRDGHTGPRNHGAGDRTSFRDVRIEELPARPAA
ncbi:MULTISPECIES: hypothetical protein [Streptomyces]|uniref:Uncharacterized protein n=1 Tax=Streptomyces chilikensis TaxID=1194079 RepID=A0ABV3EQ35_9ACTN|nr:MULTISPECIES: hypothetical protein [Streptomyces]MDH6223700.1 hypothetical protein [Streptomyces sp. MJP52]